MEIWSAASIAVLLWAAAAWLMSTHVRTWRMQQEQAGELEPNELDYRRRQFRRRMQTSAMLGLVGVGMLVGRLLIVFRAHPLVVVVFWGGVMLLVVWLGLLAVADIVSTRYYFGRLRQNYQVEESRLKAELRRLERRRGNGQTDAPHGKKGKGPQAPEDSPD